MCPFVFFYLYLFGYERDFMGSLANEKGNDMIVAFNTTSRDTDNCSISIIFTLNK